jgi:hypothetical protein
LFAGDAHDLVVTVVSVVVAFVEMGAKVWWKEVVFEKCKVMF